MKLIVGVASLLLSGASAGSCTVPADTRGADDGNPHCWDRKRRCDGPNAHPDGGPGYQPACGLCEGIGGIAWGDDAQDIHIPKCTPIATADKVSPPPARPAWGQANGKFTIENDRFIMIGKKTDPFCFKFFPSNNSVGNQCYRRQTGKLVYDMSGKEKAIRYDLNIHIPWPSDKYSAFGNITTTILHKGPNMWILNRLPLGVHQCICTQPLSAAAPGQKHNPDPIYPVMFNWTNHLNYVGREELEVEYGIGKLQVEHWTYGPHHAWTKVGDDKIVRMWQPYNGFEVFEPGTWKDGVADSSVFEGMSPPALCKKGGATMRIDCTDGGLPKPKMSMQEPVAVSDLKRARTKVPRSTHKGRDFSDVSAKLNKFVQTMPNAKECARWTVEELQQFQAMLLNVRSDEIDSIYRKTNDRRLLRGDFGEHLGRWARLASVAKSLGGRYEEMYRNGHCHEAVMWFTHHLSESVRQQVAAMTAVPMLPYTSHDCTSGFFTNDQKMLCDEYLKQVSCQDCHADATAPSTLVV